MATSSKATGKTAASKSKAAPPKKAPAAAPVKAKKVEQKAAPAKKPAAPTKKAAAPAKKPASRPAKKGDGAMAASCGDDQRRHYIEVAAYYIAERRGFHGGSELEDWIQAEAEVESMLRQGFLAAD